MNTLQRLIRTENNLNWFLLRVPLGIVMLAHGLQKAFGWFKGFGWKGSMDYFTGFVGLPYWLGVVVILIESAGALLLILGLGGRINAALMIIVMAGAFFVDHLSNGFFMNWGGQARGEGYEFDILFVSMALVLVINGSGKYSLDRLIMNRGGKLPG
ncbi:MAG TPA: DoxX family protein [Flavisolibacter sp.]|nr:DoxX family protein [Flavisolibacter sp.]